MTLYGLTCGFWSANAEAIDSHVLRHVHEGKDSDLYDLACDRAPVGGVVLHDCGDGVK